MILSKRKAKGKRCRILWENCILVRPNRGSDRLKMESISCCHRVICDARFMLLTRSLFHWSLHSSKLCFASGGRVREFPGWCGYVRRKVISAWVYWSVDVICMWMLVLPELWGDKSHPKQSIVTCCAQPVSIDQPTRWGLSEIIYARHLWIIKNYLWNEDRELLW